jgi:hypothetical protein
MYRQCLEVRWMMPRQAPRVLLIILAVTVLWAAFVLIQRPVLRSRDVNGLDWNNVVGFPVAIVAIFMVSRYIAWRNNPAPRASRSGIGEALATGVAWGVIKALQERYTFGAVTMAPLVSGAVVCLAVLVGNWIVRRLLRNG